MSLSATLDALLAPSSDEPQAARRSPAGAPKGWEPSATWDNDSAEVTTSPWPMGDPEPAEAALLSERGLDPASWKVERVRYSEWQQSRRLDNGDRDMVTLRAKRVSFIRRAAGMTALDPSVLAGLLTAGRATKRTRTALPNAAPVAFVHAGGDYQLGKLDGDGIDGTVARFHAALTGGVERLQSTMGSHNVTAVYLPHLGDCIEGYVSQGGRNAMRTGLPLTEQVDLLIMLMCEQVRAYAPHAARIVVPVVPGNHDESMRSPVDGLEHDSWATFAAKQLRRALDMAGSTYDHVSIVAPARGELTLTLDMAGTSVGMAHGHQFGPGKAHDWWDGQHHGMQLIGDARILLTAHAHHLRVEQSGIKTHVQVPALEGESRWWRHRKGQQSPPGMVTFLAGEHAGRPLTLPDGHRVCTGWDALVVA